jgi:hypothetical protein
MKQEDALLFDLAAIANCNDDPTRGLRQLCYDHGITEAKFKALWVERSERLGHGRSQINTDYNNARKAVRRYTVSPRFAAMVRDIVLNGSVRIN